MPMWLGLDHDPADEQPPTYVCARHRWADDSVPCEQCQADEVTHYLAEFGLPDAVNQSAAIKLWRNGAGKE